MNTDYAWEGRQGEGVTAIELFISATTTAKRRFTAKTKNGVTFLEFAALYIVFGIRVSLLILSLDRE